MSNEDEIEINRESIILAEPGIVLKEESDHWGLLHNPDNDYSFGINPVSVYIWKQLKSKQTVKELVNKVRIHFTNVAEEVEEDVIEFIKKLLDKGLATLNPPGK